MNEDLKIKEFTTELYKLINGSNLSMSVIELVWEKIYRQINMQKEQLIKALETQQTEVTSDKDTDNK